MIGLGDSAADEQSDAGLVDVLSPAEPVYILPKDDVAELIISPALRVCDSADVMIGYFASQSLAEIAPCAPAKSTISPLMPLS